MTARSTARSVQVFLLAMSVLALEVALTRIFSFVTYHHFTFLVISVAMLGFGAAGSYLTVRPPLEELADGRDFVPRHAGLFALATLAAAVLIPRIHFFPMDIYYRRDFSNFLSLLVIVFLTSLPFFFAGTCIGHILTRAGTAMHQVYFADLTGAALGCLAALALINYAGAVGTCFAIAAIGLLVAALTDTRHRWRYLGGAIMTLLAAVALAQHELLPLYPEANKELSRQENLIDYTRWHVITRIDVMRPATVSNSFGGALSPVYQGPPPEVRIIYQDGTNLTGIIHPTGPPAEMPVLGYYLQGAPYVLRPGADALTIGCGGGVDVLIGLHHGARHMVGVDVNPHMIEVVRDRYRDFAGDLAQRNDVELVAAEGRHFLTRDQRQYDVIQLSGVDTFAALTTGAYALTENYIYTREALAQYLRHLKPDGIVNISRPLFDPPRETLKLSATAVEVLEQFGAPRPADHLVILAGQGTGAPAPWAQTMVKRAPFTPNEVETLVRWAEPRAFRVVYDPFTPRAGQIDTLIRAAPQQRAALIAGHDLNIVPATDDRPFYFQFYRWCDLASLFPAHGSGARTPLALLILLASLAQIILLSAVFILYPLYRSSVKIAQPGGRARAFAYFAALGLGFILVEISLLQKLTVFLGGPAYSMAITLFTLLLASGAGSLCAQRWSNDPLRVLRTVIPLLALGIVVESLLLDDLIPRCLQFALPLRGLAAAVFVAPLGFLMGMPFPTGLRYIDRFRAELNPWAWGINACATVAGTMICILLSTLVGFRITLQLAAVLYVAGWLPLATGQPAVPKLARQHDEVLA
ncbi:MAG TPA: class I SAM-dependent methyltransferase [Phycisphaerae bacterium]|nr:class I SAM-dependent methyltransferase [Phycisphaerae bacterium]